MEPRRHMKCYKIRFHNEKHIETHIDDDLDELEYQEHDDDADEDQEQVVEQAGLVLVALVGVAKDDVPGAVGPRREVKDGGLVGFGVRRHWAVEGKTMGWGRTKDRRVDLPKAEKITG